MFEKTNLNLLNLPLTEMGESLTYNPTKKAKVAAEPKKQPMKARKARGQLQDTIELPDEELLNEKAKLGA